MLMPFFSLGLSVSSLCSSSSSSLLFGESIGLREFDFYVSVLWMRRDIDRE